MEDLVSIIIANFNKEKYIAQAINSLLGQTYSNLELIVIDDGSTDKSPEIINFFAKKDKRIRYYPRPHEGKVKACNFGVTQATGEYIKIYASDDVLFSDAIYQLIRRIKGYDVVIHNCTVVSESLAVVKDRLMDMKQYENEITVFDVIKGMGCASGNYFMTRKAAKEIFPIPVVASYEDWYIYLMVIKNGLKVNYFDRSLGLYRQTPDGAFGGVGNYKLKTLVYRAKRDKEMLVLFRNILPRQYKNEINNKIRECELIYGRDIWEIFKSNFSVQKKAKMLLKIRLNLLYRLLLFFSRLAVWIKDKLGITM